MKEIFATAKIPDTDLTKYLIKIGALYVDKNGIHASKPGVYPKKENIPARTTNQSRDSK